ncbi:MAG: histidine kinase [Allobranchiibius sp.]
MWAEPAVSTAPVGIGRRDQVLAAVVLVAVSLEVATRPDSGWPPAAAGIGFVLTSAVLVRRSRCLVGVVLAFGAFLVVDVTAFALGAAPVTLYSGAVVLLLVYSLFRWGAGRNVVFGMIVVVGEFTVATLTDSSAPMDVVGGAAVLMLSAALGAAVRYRGVAREQLIEQARLQEREHLARELHDIVAHHVCAIAVQAQAGVVLAGSGSPGGATEALETIEGEAARTLAEMRSLVGDLRDRPHQPPLVPGRRLADIKRLALSGKDALRVDVKLRGDLDGLSSAVEAALYRVAQESVTNAQRHARLATQVEVTVTRNVSDVQLTVDDDGAPTPTAHQPGYGLIGMTERVTLLGGTLEAGPGPDHGWCVHAVLPSPRRTT